MDDWFDRILCFLAIASAGVLGALLVAMALVAR